MSTRIVGGAARGRRLQVPATGTRPTSERTREALFNTLAGLLDLDGARVLDLYAGSGAVGLEALSRGAAAVFLVDDAREAERACAANIAAVALPGAQTIGMPVGRFLAVPPSDPFELVFADPPYAIDDAELAAAVGALEGGWLAPEAVVVVERPARAGQFSWPDVIEPIKHRRYGEAVLWYGRRR